MGFVFNAQFYVVTAYGRWVSCVSYVFLRFFTHSRYFRMSMVQVFTLIAMEQPIRVSGTGSADYVRDAKVIATIRVFAVSGCCYVMMYSVALFELGPEMVKLEN